MVAFSFSEETQKFTKKQSFSSTSSFKLQLNLELQQYPQKNKSCTRA